MAEKSEFKHYRVVNAGGPRVIHHAGGTRLLEKGASFVGAFHPGNIEAMQRPGRMLHLTEASEKDAQAFALENARQTGSAPLVPEGAQDRFDGMSDDELRAFVEETSGQPPRANAKRETLLRRARGGAEE